MENEREVLLEVNHLNVTYGSGKKAYEAVQDANFKIYKGRMRRMARPMVVLPLPLSPTRPKVSPL